MSLNSTLLPRDGTGRVRCTVAAPARINGGTPNAATGQLAISANAPTTFVGGLGYYGPSGNPVAVDVGGAVAFFSQGYAFTSAGRLALDSAAPITVHLAGIPRTASGAIAVVVE